MKQSYIIFNFDKFCNKKIHNFSGGNIKEFLKMEDELLLISNSEFDYNSVYVYFSDGSFAQMIEKDIEEIKQIKVMFDLIYIEGAWYILTDID